MNTGKQQKPVLTGQRFKTRKRGECPFSALSIYTVLQFCQFNKSKYPFCLEDCLKLIFPSKLTSIQVCLGAYPHKHAHTYKLPKGSHALQSFIHCCKSPCGSSLPSINSLFVSALAQH